VPELSLVVGGYQVSGWTEVSVTASIDELAHTFDLGLSHRATKADPLQENIRPGAACEIRMDNVLVLRGFIDDVEDSDEAEGFELRVSGRSKAGDLVDCAALHKGGWSNTPLKEIARDLCEPFKIGVHSDVASLPVERYFRLNDGETVFAALDRLARDHGMRIVSDPDGDVRFVRVGAVVWPDVVLERKVNLVRSSRSQSWAERYSEYIFKAQIAADDETNGEDASAVKYAITDDGVDRYRPLVVHADSQRGGAALKARAEWERNTRAGASLRISASYQDPRDPRSSWVHPRGGIWTPNHQVTLRDPRRGIERLFLIVSRTLARSGTGTTTELELCPPEAYQPEKPPRKKSKGIPW